MDVHFGIEGTNSNGHGEGKDENMNMEETIKNLQKDVQIHKYDNERLMRAKEQQYDFNMKLMKVLNIMENKLDKVSGSRKSGSHKSLYEKRRERSVSRHHHHFLRHSNNREQSCSGPSPVKKHKRSKVKEI